MPRQELHTSALRKKRTRSLRLGTASRKKTSAIVRFGTPKIEPIYDDTLAPSEMTPKQPSAAKANAAEKIQKTRSEEVRSVERSEEARRAYGSRENAPQNRHDSGGPSPTVFERLTKTERFASPEAIAKEQQRAGIVQSQIQLAPPPHELQTAEARKKKRADGVLEGFARSMRLFVQRLIALLKPQARMTVKGRAALAQLMQLYHLLLAQSGDGMDLVELKFAFGQAYFDVMQAAKRNRVRKERADDEDYSDHFVRFLRELDA